MRKDWMFKLVGTEHFTIGKARCCITIDAAEGFMYQYLLEVNGKTLEKFTENQSKIMNTWLCDVSGMPFRIVLGMIASSLCITNCFITSYTSVSVCSHVHVKYWSSCVCFVI